MAAEHFADRLMAAITTKNSRVCVGLDPRPDRLPHGTAVYEFCRRIVEAVAPWAACVKPNAAFFEALGPEGLDVLWRVAAHAQELGLPVILDAKRGDIGSTAAAYAHAYLRPDAPFDALTVNPLFGSDGIKPFVERAAEAAKGVFVLVKTSNPSAGELQDQQLAAGRPLYRRVADLVNDWGREHVGSGGYSLVGAVVAATYPEQLGQLRRLMPAIPFLVPGYGAQGAGPQDVAAAFDKHNLGAVVNSSRAIIYAYQQPQYAGLDYAEAAASATRSIKDDINKALGIT